MKKVFLRFICLLILSVVTLHTYGQEVNPVTYSPEKPIVGEVFHIRYDNTDTPLAGEDAIWGIVYFWRDLHWEGQDLKMVKRGGAWEADFLIPEDCALLVLRFTANGKVDNGGRNTYAMITSRPEGGNLPAGYLGWGMLRNETLMSYSGLVDKSAYIDDEEMRFWINNELKYFPDAMEYVFYYAHILLDKIAPGHHNERIAADIDYITNLESVDEKMLVDANVISKKVLRDPERSAAIEELSMRKYPDGIISRDKEIMRISSIKDMDERKREFAVFVERFPYEKFKNADAENSRELNSLFRSIIYTSVDESWDYVKLYEYAPQSSYNNLALYFWHLVQIPLMHEQRTPEQLLPVANFLFEQITTRERTGANRRFSDKEWEKRIFTYKDGIRDYAEILNETGSKEEALVIVERIKGYYGFKTAKFNDLYVRLLQRNGYGSLVVSTIKECVREDAVTPRMLDILKEDYIASNGSEAGYDEYVNSLKSAEKIQKMQEHLLESLINMDIEPFTLEGPGGVKVNSADLKGKIIVLDFWATWCAPCKAAMPGMQMVVNKYKDDPNVEFYFIATMEKGNYLEQIDKFMTKMNYDMNVLYDGVNPETGANDAVYSKYSGQIRSGGIPLKMMIDGNGKLRWASNGYMGSPSALVEELSFLIETLKAE